MPTDYNKVREKLREWLVDSTDCDIHDGWPCGTCTTHLFGMLRVVENGEHNEPVDRVNEVWRSILQIRAVDIG